MKSRQLAAALDRLADEAADDAVGLAEGHAPADEQVGDLGRGKHLVAGCVLHALAVELDPGQHPGGRVEAELDRFDRVEERLLVLLHVLAVGQRQRVHDPEQGRVAGGDAGALGPQQLGRVRVELLRHDRGAGGEGLVELAEAELGAGPDDEFRAQAREVHRAGGGGGQVVEDEVAVGGAVDRVVGDVLEAEVGGDGVAVDLPVDPGQGAGAERHHAGAVERELEAEDVAGKHPEIGQQVVAEVDGLGALEVGVAGHRPVLVRLGQRQQALHRRPAELDRLQRVDLDHHRHVGGDLVVAGAAGVELAGQRPDLLAEQALDRHVDVLVGVLEGEAMLGHAGAHPLQAGVDLGQLLRVENADPEQAAGVGPRLVDVVGRQLPVEWQRAVERPEARVWIFAKAAHQGRDRIAVASSWQTRSTSASLIAGKKGSARECAAAASATGNWPSR